MQYGRLAVVLRIKTARERWQKPAIEQYGREALQIADPRLGYGKPALKRNSMWMAKMYAGLVAIVRVPVSSLLDHNRRGRPTAGRGRSSGRGDGDD